MASDQAAQATTFFSRKATGLVRESSLINTAAFNILNVTIAYAILYPALFAWQFPGSNLLLAGVLAVGAFVPLGICYALIVAAMPRAGSDYVFLSRVFHPVVGFVLSVVFIVWVCYWSGIGVNYFFTLGLAPQMPVLGHESWGTWLSDHTHVILMGAAVLVVLAAITAVSTRLALRVLTVMVVLGILSTIIAGVVLLTVGHNDFINSFNSFAKPYTHSNDSYHQVIAQAKKDGYNPDHPFALGATLSLLPWFATAFLYVAGQAALGGEIKRPARNSFVAIYITLGAMLSLVLLVFIGLGVGVSDTFNNSASYLALNDPEHWPLPNAPNYNFLATIAVSNEAMRWLMTITFAIWYLPGPILNYIFISRYLMATSIDGILPQQLSTVNPRTHTPVRALAIGAVAAIASLIILTERGHLQTLMSAVLGELIGAYLLVSIGAIAFPLLKRTRHVYRASPANIRVGGLPLMSIMGGLSTVFLLVFAWAFWTKDDYGVNSNWSKAMVFIIPAAAITIYGLSWAWHRMRDEDLSLAFKEIPPE
jgi:amino acid transporter